MTAPERQHLLVVDDDATNRDMLSRRLERRGYSVAVAASGEEALEYLTQHPVATVLLDVQMPGMTGLEVLQRIRQTWPASRLPVLMVTAKDQSEDVVTALDLAQTTTSPNPLIFPLPSPASERSFRGRTLRIACG